MARKPAIKVEPTVVQVALIREWLAAKTAAASAKELEMDKRKAVVAAFFPEGADEGTNNIDIGGGYGLKYVRKYNYKLGPTVDEVDDLLDSIRALGNEGTFIADRLVKWTPEMSLSEYRALSAAETSSDLTKKIKGLVDKALTITDASPELETIEPKAAKE